MKKITFCILAGSVMFLNGLGQNLPSGEANDELQSYFQRTGVNSQVGQILASSARFRSILSTMNSKYVSFNKQRNPAIHNMNAWGSLIDGIFTMAPFRNKRLLGVYPHSGSSFFHPGDPDNPYEGWYLVAIGPKPALSLNTTNQLMGWEITYIAHEFGHAFLDLTATREPAAAARIRSSVTNEIRTREIEIMIVTQALAGNTLTGFIYTHSDTTRRQVERDFISGNVHLTYLESFVMGEQENAAIIKDAIPVDSIKKINRYISSLPMKWTDAGSVISVSMPNGLLEPLAPGYPTLRYIRRIIHKDWEEYNRQYPQGNAAEMEKILQEHVADYFNGLASYSP